MHAARVRVRWKNNNATTASQPNKIQQMIHHCDTQVRPTSPLIELAYYAEKFIKNGSQPGRIPGAGLTLSALQSISAIRSQRWPIMPMK